MNSSKKTSGSDPADQDATQGGGPADARTAALEAQVQALQVQVGKLTDLAARAQADLQNAKIRMEKDAGELGKFAAEGLLKKFIPVIDHFQRAFQHLPEDLKNHEWIKGVAAIEQDFMKQITGMGLERMETLGQPADPQKHEILLESPGEKGMVIEVLEDGYELNGKVLRAAKVRVGDGKEETEEPEESEEK